MAARPLPALVAAALLAAALSGCTSATDEQATATEQPDSPLTALLASVQGTDIDDAAFAAQNDRIEELVAACMTAEGFEYTPVPFIVAGPADVWQPDDAGWVAQWGYGATTWPGKAETQRRSEEGDANSAYVATLSEAESDAYFAVLYGATPTQEQVDAGEVDDVVTWDEQGCYGSASHEVRGDDPTLAPENAPIMDAVAAFRDAELAAPEQVEVDSDWADCMAAAGRTGFERQPDAEQSVYDGLDDYYLNNEWTEDSPELLALHDAEVELALVDLDCRESTDYRSRTRAIQDGLEQQFIADHRAELDALLAQAVTD